MYARVYKYTVYTINVCTCIQVYSIHYKCMHHKYTVYTINVCTTSIQYTVYTINVCTCIQVYSIHYKCMHVYTSIQYTL